MSSGGERRIAYAAFFRKALEKAVGRSLLATLEYQVSKRLSGANPYEALLERPQDFYRAPAPILGADRALTTLKLAFEQIIDEHGLTGWSPEELARALARGGGEACALKPSRRPAPPGGQVAPKITA